MTPENRLDYKRFIKQLFLLITNIINHGLVKVKRSKDIIFSQFLIFNLVCINNVVTDKESKKMPSRNSIWQTKVDCKI